MKNIYSLALLIFTAVTITPAYGQTAQRLTGTRNNNFSSITHSMELYDSFSYVYGPGRGAVDPENLMYDTKTEVNNSGNYLKSVCQFNSSNYPVQLEFQQWTGSGWGPAYRMLFTYNSNHQTTEFIQQQYFVNTWYSLQKVAFAFNSHGDTTMYATYNGDTSSVWTLNSRMDMYYNAQHHLIAQLDNMVTGGIINDTSALETFAYDAGGNRTDHNVYLNDTANVLYHYSRNSYQYDVNNLLQNEQKDLYTNGAWMPDNSVVYYYYGNNLLQRKRHFYADGLGGLQPGAEYEYTYTPTGLCDTLIWREYDANLANFKVISRSVYAYNAAGKLTLEEREDPDMNGIYQPVWNTQNTYDTANNKTYSVFTYANDTVANQETFYWYETYQVDTGHTPTGIVPVGAVQVNVYPNPVHGNLTIALQPGCYGRIAVYSPDGKQVLNSTVAETATRINLATQHWPAGIYILQLSGAAQVYTQRVIVE